MGSPDVSQRVHAGHRLAGSSIVRNNRFNRNNSFYVRLLLTPADRFAGAQAAARNSAARRGWSCFVCGIDGFDDEVELRFVFGVGGSGFEGKAADEDRFFEGEL